MTLGQLGSAASRRTSRARLGGGQRCWGSPRSAGRRPSEYEAGLGSSRRRQARESEAAIGHGPAEAEQAVAGGG
jgi:hypothetical protein